MQIERKNLCPLFKGPCRQLDCAWFMEIEGKHPQTGEQIKEWSCAVVWQVMVGLKISQDVTNGTSGVQAATESFRNEVVRMNGPPADIRLIE